MSVLTVYSQMILFERYRLNQQVILKQYIKTLQPEKLEAVYSEVTCISKWNVKMPLKCFPSPFSLLPVPSGKKYAVAKTPQQLHLWV